MDYKNTKDFPIHPLTGDSPFKVEGLVTRRITWKKRNHTVIDESSGELMQLQKAEESKEVIIDAKDFIKTYKPFFKILPTLSQAALQLLAYIMDNIVSESNTVLISRTEFFEVYNNSIANNNYYRGLGELLKHDVIRRTEHYNIFWYNTNYFFNGRRNKITKKTNGI